MTVIVILVYYCSTSINAFLTPEICDRELIDFVFIFQQYTSAQTLPAWPAKAKCYVGLALSSTQDIGEFSIILHDIDISIMHSMTNHHVCRSAEPQSTDTYSCPSTSLHLRQAFSAFCSIGFCSIVHDPL